MNRSELPAPIVKALINAEGKITDVPEEVVEHLVRNALRDDPFLRAQMMPTMRGEGESVMQIDVSMRLIVPPEIVRKIHDKMVREMEQRT